MKNLLPKDINGCPYLFLAPMEGVGDSCFRKAMASCGGFDEAVTEFMRVPINAHVQSLAKVYVSNETWPIPLAAQLMGSDPELMAEMAIEVVKRGALRVDLNCGCPSNTVTGKGAGSSLLKDPNSLYSIAKALVKAVSVPVTIKMRSGYEDTSLFKENLKAAEESGAAFITLHPRTKVEGYTPPANWALIRIAKECVKIPIVGNGDITSVELAKKMIFETGCDALMIGRGSVIDPFIFKKIKANYAGTCFLPTWEHYEKYLETYLQSIKPDMPERSRINKMKQLFGFLFQGNEALKAKRGEILTFQSSNLNDLVKFATATFKECY